jgi:hypothetical protein
LKRSKQLFILILVFLLTLVLPMAILAGREENEGDRQKEARIILTEAPILKELIENQITYANGLEQAKARLKQLERDYEAASALGESGEMDFLAQCILTEKSNIVVLNDLLNQTRKEINQVKALIKNREVLNHYW